MTQLSAGEERMVALVIVSIRYGIGPDSIKHFLQVEVPDVAQRNRIFIKALEYNERIDSICGTGELAVSLIVEHVREFFKELRKPVESPVLDPTVNESPIVQTATVIRRYTMASPAEVSLGRLGQQVVVAGENDIWTYIEIPETNESGWVPRDTLSYNEQT